jgi:hypothetical protein
VTFSRRVSTVRSVGVAHMKDGIFDLSTVIAAETRRNYKLVCLLTNTSCNLTWMAREDGVWFIWRLRIIAACAIRIHAPPEVFHRTLVAFGDKKGCY